MPEQDHLSDEVEWDTPVPATGSAFAAQGCWKILVADDDESMQEVTALVLAGQVLHGRPIELLRALSGEAALRLLRQHPDTAVVLLDVVMESDDAGLRVAREIRHTLGNERVRIVLRTGQPGHAPERTVVDQYEIDGYEAKTEVSAQRLLTVVTTAVRAYDMICANRAKSEFLSNMSHELRTPMHAILSFTEIARTRLNEGAADLPRLERYLGRIDDSGRRLLHLLDDLLDMAKLEERRMRYDFGVHDFSVMLESVLQEFEPLLAKAQLRVHTEFEGGERQVWCDAFRIGQVLRNLLGNAIKFTPPGKKIQVRLVAEPDHALISVADEGLGIPEAELQTIFDKFVQSSKTKSGAGGTGLGLSIAREIVSQHGGEISAVNGARGGAVFTFTLPRQAQQLPGQNLIRGQ